ncbi:MAG: FAD-dependent oxidoreductase [Pseudomonadota bacterium]
MVEETSVLIIGGGPVGLTLAIDLARRGVDCTLVERREEATKHPKATLLGARSMELYRRWGLDEAIYEKALPPQHNYFIIFATRLAKQELYRFTSPSIDQIRSRDPDAAKRFRELAWSPYGKTQIGQQKLEPVLVSEALRQAPTLSFKRGWRMDRFEQDADGVTATIVGERDGTERQIRAQYMVACDGGSSRVRKALNIPMNGRGAMRANTSFFFRAPDFLGVHGLGVANLYFVFADDSFGVFTAIDGKELWNYQYYFLDPAKETRDLDAKEVLSRAVGKTFDFEQLEVTHWHHHQSIAARWRAGNVFLAGDAAHLFAPTGGVGMNTGIGDACDLAWKLAGTLQGWGGPRLLDSYEAERKPIAIRNSLISATNSDKIDLVMAETPPDIDRDGPEGYALRAGLASKIKWLARQFNSAGTHLGYRYADSPICVADGSPEPPDDTAVVVPSTWPGSRAPHVWIEDGRSSLDLFGDGFTLLVLGEDAADTEVFVGAAKRAGLPMDVVPATDLAMIASYEARFVLVRPDGHVAWRGASLPDDPTKVLARVRGA